MHTNFTLKPNSIRFGFVSSPISRSDFISISNLTERSDLILVSNLLWKGDSQFNSTIASEMKMSLAKFMTNSQCCTHFSDHNGLSIKLVFSINPSWKIKWNQMESLPKTAKLFKKNETTIILCILIN